MTTANSIYRINPQGVASLILRNKTLLSNYEGLVVVPEDSRYGSMAGTLLLPQSSEPQSVATYFPSGGLRAGQTIAIVTKAGNVTYINTPCHADSLFIGNSNFNL